MKKIFIKNNVFVLVSDCDFDHINQHKWGLMSSKSSGHLLYAVRSRGIFMHREILKAPKGKHVDHINGNGLDNRRSNLRLCTTKQNIRNSRLRKDNKTGFKGVYVGNRKYRACIKVDGKNINLGTFDDLEEAAMAYDKAAIKYFGEFANTNF